MLTDKEECKCLWEDTRVYFTKRFEDYIRRHRRCTKCQKKFTTKERVFNRIPAKTLREADEQLADKKRELAILKRKIDLDAVRSLTRSVLRLQAENDTLKRRLK